MCFMPTPRALPCALLTLLLAPLVSLDGQERAVLIKTPEANAAPEAETPTPDADQAPSGGVDESIVVTGSILCRPSPNLVKYPRPFDRPSS